MSEEKMECKLNETNEDYEYEMIDKVSVLEQSLSEEQAKAAGLEKALADAQARISELEAKIEQDRLTRLEYEGLRDLYSQKVKQFNDTLEEKEEKFAKEEAVKRYKLDNEIQKNRQDNQVFVSDTIKSFYECIQFYLIQVKQLVETIGEVTLQTGQGLFDENNADCDLRSVISQQISEILQNKNAALGGEEDGLIMFANKENLCGNCMDPICTGGEEMK